MPTTPDAAAQEVALESDAMSQLKPDWRQARQRMIDWWAGRRTDRVPASVVAPRDGAAPTQARGTPAQRHADPPTVFENLDNELAGTFYGGEAFPMHFVYIGAVPMGGFLGCELEFRPESVWQGRMPFGWDQADRVSFDPANKWWRLLCDLTAESCRRARGRYLVTACGGGAFADVMVNMFGCEETLVAMLERPADVRRLRDRMAEWTGRMFRENWGLVEPFQRGHADWLRIWAPGRFHTFQCDVAVMLSPATFRDLFLEEIRQECRSMEYSLYHLDGSAQLVHLDALLSIEELGGIQWNPEPAVSGDPCDFAPDLRRILRAGKKLYLSCAPDRVRPVLDALGTEGVYLSIYCKTESQARRTLGELEKIGTTRP